MTVFWLGEREQRLRSRFEYQTLEEDADEVLLELLRRDLAEPLPWHPPHRRWAGPPLYGDGPDGRFTRVGHRWWKVTPTEEVRRAEWEAEERHRLEIARQRAEYERLKQQQFEEELAARKARAADLTAQPLVSDEFLDLLWAAGEYLQVYRYLAQRVSRRGLI